MKIVGLPISNGSKIPGCELGVNEIINHVINSGIIDRSDIYLIENFNDSYLSYRKKQIYRDLKNDKKILFIGSNHVCTTYIMNDILNIKFDNLYIFDAHCDFDNRIEYEKNRYNWNIINHIRKFIDNEIFVLGYRYFDKQMECSFVNTITDLDFIDYDHILEVIAQSISKNIYISIDMDSINPVEFPGTSFKEPAGLYLRELITTVKKLIFNSNYCVIDICEFNPLIEKDMSLRAIERIIREINYI